MRTLKRIRRVLAVMLVVPAALLLLFVGSNAVGWIPVNTDYVADPNGVDVYVYCGEIHSELILPVEHPQLNWRDVFPASDFHDPAPEAQFVAFGWGDREFFRNTPTWSDFDAGWAIRALAWPTATALHVAWRDEQSVVSRAHRVRISQTGYREMVDSIVASLEYGEEGRLVPLSHNGYRGREAFYRARGRYHLLNTCNNWVNRRLKRAGVRTGRWTPTPQAINANLPPCQTP